MVDLFRKYIATYELNQEGSEYRPSKLKRRLQKSHPQLVFHPSSGRNKSEIVFAENLSAGTLANQLIDSEDSESDTSSELENKLSERHAHVHKNECLDLFRAATILRSKLEIVPSMQCQWPTADDFTDTAVMESVSTELFSFLCWITGFSDDPSFESLREFTHRDSRKEN